MLPPASVLSPLLLPEPPELLLPELLPLPELVPLPELLPPDPPLELWPLLDPLLLLLLPSLPESPVLPSGEVVVVLLLFDELPQSVIPSDKTVAKGASRKTQSVCFLSVMGTPKFLQVA